MTASRISGRISYSRAGEETGREWFDLIGHPISGARTLRAFCQMDDAGITRDVTYLLDAAFRPVDAFCRVTTDGAVSGSALFLCSADALDCEALTAELGRVSQHIAIQGPAGYLGLHPLVGDALAAHMRGRTQPGEFLPVAGFTNSISPNGDKGLIATPVVIEAAYVGPEEVSVPAGTFVAERFALRWSPEWPPADLWVTGPEALFVRMHWSLVDAIYELTELVRHA